MHRRRQPRGVERLSRLTAPSRRRSPHAWLPVTRTPSGKAQCRRKHRDVDCAATTSTTPNSVGCGQPRRRRSRPLSDCASRPVDRSWRAEVHAPALGRRRRSQPPNRAARSRSARSTLSSAYPESVAAQPRPPGPRGLVHPWWAQPSAQKGPGTLRRSAPDKNLRPPLDAPTFGARPPGSTACQVRDDATRLNDAVLQRP